MPKKGKVESCAAVVHLDSVNIDKIKDYELPQAWTLKACQGLYSLAAVALGHDRLVVVIGEELVVPASLLDIFNDRRAIVLRVGDDFNSEAINDAISRLCIDDEVAEADDSADKGDYSEAKQAQEEVCKDGNGKQIEDFGAGESFVGELEFEPLQAVDDKKARPVRREFAPDADSEAKCKFDNIPSTGELLSRQEIQALLGRKDDGEK